MQTAGARKKEEILDSVKKISSLINKEINKSMQVLKSNQLSALESLATLLLREVESLKNSENLVNDGIKENNGISLYDEMHNFETGLIRSALIQSGGVQSRAAKLLGVKVTTLNVKIKRYKINFGTLEESSIA